MKVIIRHIGNKADEQVVIECVEEGPEVNKIRAFALLSGEELAGIIDERIYQFKLVDVYYFEAIDERVYAYTNDKVYELKIRLYELQNAYAEHYFVRVSKSFLINLMKLDSISPALNGRFTAHMKNGEQVMISRQYVPELKQIVTGGKK